MLKTYGSIEALSKAIPSLEYWWEEELASNR